MSRVHNVSRRGFLNSVFSYYSRGGLDDAQRGARQ